MKKIIYVIQEGSENLDFNVVGVANDLNIIDQMLSDYYGEFTVIKETDVRDSNIVWCKKIETDFKGRVFKSSVWVERFALNEV